MSVNWDWWFKQLIIIEWNFCIWYLTLAFADLISIYERFLFKILKEYRGKCLSEKTLNYPQKVYLRVNCLLKIQTDDKNFNIFFHSCSLFNHFFSGGCIYCISLCNSGGIRTHVDIGKWYSSTCKTIVSWQCYQNNYLGQIRDFSIKKPGSWSPLIKFSDNFNGCHW